jgi:hypothetical protein
VESSPSSYVFEAVVPVNLFQPRDGRMIRVAIISIAVLMVVAWIATIETNEKGYGDMPHWFKLLTIGSHVIPVPHAIIHQHDQGEDA